MLHSFGPTIAISATTSNASDSGFCGNIIMSRDLVADNPLDVCDHGRQRVAAGLRGFPRMLPG